MTARHRSLFVGMLVLVTSCGARAAEASGPSVQARLGYSYRYVTSPVETSGHQPPSYKGPDTIHLSSSGPDASLAIGGHVDRNVLLLGSAGIMFGKTSEGVDATQFRLAMELMLRFGIVRLGGELGVFWLRVPRVTQPKESLGAGGLVFGLTASVDLVPLGEDGAVALYGSLHADGSPTGLGLTLGPTGGLAVRF